VKVGVVDAVDEVLAVGARLEFNGFVCALVWLSGIRGRVIVMRCQSGCRVVEK